jgi:hypothetical protein
MTCPCEDETTARSGPTRLSGRTTTPGCRSRVMWANVSSAASIAARGIRDAFEVGSAGSTASYSDTEEEGGLAQSHDERLRANFARNP